VLARSCSQVKDLAVISGGVLEGIGLDGLALLGGSGGSSGGTLGAGRVGGAVGSLAGRGELSAVDFHNLVLALLDGRSDRVDTITVAKDGLVSSRGGIVALSNARLTIGHVQALGSGLVLSLSLSVALEEDGRVQVRVSGAVVHRVGRVTLGTRGELGGSLLDVQVIKVLLGRVDIASEVVIQACLALDLLTTTATRSGRSIDGSLALTTSGRGAGSRSLSLGLGLLATLCCGANSDLSRITAVVNGIQLGLANSLDLAEVELESSWGRLAEKLLDLCL
jgi:hypothetical protein